jgi:Tol biopolymer transport system component
MPDVQEVFRMSTQKVRQDPGAMDRQLNRQRRSARNRKVGTFAMVGCIMAVIVAAVVAREERGQPAPSVAGEPGGTGQTLSVVDVHSGTAIAFSAPLGASDFEFTLDGSMVAYSDLDQNGDAQMFVMDADGSDTRQLTHGESGRPRGPDWSPDGSMIAYERATTDHSQIFVVRVSDGGSTQVTTEPRGAVDPAGWAPDGGSIVYSTINAEGDHHTARSVDLTTGQSRLMVPDASTPELSPDGAWIAFNSWLKPQGRLIFANIDGSERRIIARGLSDDGYQKWSPDSSQIAYVASTDADGLGTYVYDLATGRTRFATAGRIESWIDNDHILVSGR